MSPLLIAFTLLGWQTEQPGPLADGGHRLVSGWIARPAGRQMPLNTLPMTARWSADGQTLFILQAGHHEPTVTAHRAADGVQLAEVKLGDAWLGLAVAGDTLYAGGGTKHGVHVIRWREGKLTLEATWKAAEGDGFIGDVAVDGRGHVLAAHLNGDAIVELDARSGRVRRSVKTGAMPYRILPSAKEWLVSSWSGAEVLRHDAATGAIVERIAVGDHPADLARFKNDVYVAAANTNDVYRLEASGRQWRVRERIRVALTPRQPPGMTPSALELSPDGKTLWVVCSDANAVAVVDTSGAARVSGFIPAGWYPTEVRRARDGRLFVLNGKGGRSFPNHKPGRSGTEFEYVAAQQKGTLAIVDAVTPAALREYTETVRRNSPYRDALLDDAGIPEGNPVPARLDQKSPIEHVIYVVKENRTYDQIFGDFEKGNGDARLQLFGEDAGPNHRQLARDFVLFDNFYVNSDVSADGHVWSAAAIAPDYTQKLYPNLYAGRGGPFSLYWGRPPMGVTEKAANPAGGYLWTRAFQKGLTVRNYGWLVKLVKNAKEGEKQWSEAESPQLAAATNPYFRGYDLDYPDRERMKYFRRDLAEFENKGEFPRLTVMRLSNDHTSGFRAGAIAPASMFADNDLALGQLVEAMSKSRFWSKTAIFVLEDDAQSGPDHVDAHRSIAFVISPYTRRGGLVDSTMYNTVSMLRTMELILGLSPMTHFDAGATPMWRAFAATPDARPYTALGPRVPLTARNPAGTPLARRSAKLELEEADLIEDAEMNDILYLGLRGMRAPAPVRSGFGL